MIGDMEDLYRTLGVSRGASGDEIRKRYRFLAQAYHPDKFPDPDNKDRAEAEFKRVQEAYQVLSSPVRRAAYDASRPSSGSAADARAGSGPVRPRARPRPPSLWRQKAFGLTGAQWLIAFLFVVNLWLRDPIPLADELLLLVLFFTINRLMPARRGGAP